MKCVMPHMEGPATRVWLGCWVVGCGIVRHQCGRKSNPAGYASFFGFRGAIRPVWGGRGAGIWPADWVVGDRHEVCRDALRRTVTGLPACVRPGSWIAHE